MFLENSGMPFADKLLQQITEKQKQINEQVQAQGGTQDLGNPEADELITKMIGKQQGLKG